VCKVNAIQRTLHGQFKYEYVKRLQYDVRSWPLAALQGNTSPMSAFERKADVFEQVLRSLRSPEMRILMSASGHKGKSRANSPVLTSAFGKSGHFAMDFVAVQFIHI